MARRVPSTVALSALVVVAATGCGGASSPPTSAKPSAGVASQFPAGTRMAELAQAGTVRIGTSFDQPLFGLQALDGTPEGFDVEIGKLIAGELGVQPQSIEWVQTSTAVREEVLEKGAVDFVVATYTINDKRRDRIAFAGPYYQAGQDLMVKADNRTVTGVDSLRGAKARVCSTEGSTSAATIKEYVDPARIVLFDLYSKCVEALKNGRVDVVTTDNVILMGLVDQSKGAFRLVEKPFTEEPYGVGIAKGDKALCEFVNSVLAQAAKDGRYAKAWQSTAGRVAPTTPTLPAAAPCR